MQRLWGLILLCLTGLASAAPMQLVDAHIHYSEDAWSTLSPQKAIALLRAAGVKKALVSSSNDEGTQMLHRLAPELVVPVLRPYRSRGDLSRWMHDDSVPAMLADRLEQNSYAGIGEFHADGAEIELPVVQQLIALAREHGLFLHAHVDFDGLQRIFSSDPDALVLWAHAGFEAPGVIAEAMQQYPRLWADLSFREEVASAESVDPDWLDLFARFPSRFLLGTDTYTAQRWFYVGEYHERARAWLRNLPPELAQNIASRNAEALLARVGR